MQKQYYLVAAFILFLSCLCFFITFATFQYNSLNFSFLNSHTFSCICCINFQNYH